MVLEITPKMDEVMCEMKPYDFDEIFPYGGGSLRGHQLAGSITLLWGIWQSLNVFWYYCASKKSGEPYKSRSWFPLYKYPVEPILKIAIPLFAATMEIYGGFNFHYRPMFDENGLFRASNVYQHVCMYMGFTMSGLVDFLGMYVPLPEGSEQAVLTLSFASYAMLVDFHLATPKLATDTHILELWSIMAVVVFMALEVAYPRSVLLSLGRGYSMILSGAWWHIIGNMLFGGYRYWHPCYMGSVMMVSMTYSFTLIMLMVSFITTFLGVAVIHNYIFPENVRRDGFKYAPVSVGQEGDRDLELIARGGTGDDFESLDDLKKHSHKF